MEEIDTTRRLARRRMGRLAFVALLAELIAIVLGLFFGGPLFAANMVAVTPVLSSISWALMAVIGAYLGVSLTEAMKK